MESFIYDSCIVMSMVKGQRNIGIVALILIVVIAVFLLTQSGTFSIPSIPSISNGEECEFQAFPDVSCDVTQDCIDTLTNGGITELPNIRCESNVCEVEVCSELVSP